MEVTAPGDGLPSRESVAEVGAGVERRTHPRYALMVKGVVRIARMAAVNEVEVVASDISLGGMLLHTDAIDAVVAGDRVQLVFSSLRGLEPFEMSALVMWVHESLSRGFGAVSFGCEFVDTPDASINRLLIPAVEADRLRSIPQPY